MSALLRRLALALLLFSSAVSLAACDTKDYGPVHTLEVMPEWHLPPFPGATLLSQWSGPRVDDPLEGTTAAAVTREFGTDTDFVTVLKYYDGLLAPLGWSGCGSWRKGDHLFDIYEEDPQAHPSDYKQYKLVYYETLSEYLGVESPPTTPLQTCSEPSGGSPDASAS